MLMASFMVPCLVAGLIAAFFFWQRTVILSLTPLPVKIIELLLVDQVTANAQQSGIEFRWMLLFLILSKLDYVPTLIDRLNSQTKRLQFLDENAERCRDCLLYTSDAADELLV